MAADGDVDGSRARIQTYVPAYQKAEWQDHANRLDMSLSEFVRSMVQAGRRGFSADVGSSSEEIAEKPAGGHDSDADPQGLLLEQRVRSMFEDGDSHDWDELLDAVTEDVEEQLDDTLQELQSNDEIRYSGRDGGYVQK